MFRPALSGGSCRTAAAMCVCVAATLLAHSSAASQSDSIATAQGCQTPTISPPAGLLCGATESTVVNGDTVTVNVYGGIPYAVPTTNNSNAGRWQPPVAPSPWNTLQVDTGFASVCPQLLPDTATNTYYIGGSEDCLYLNVWQPPSASPSSTVPVMVFIHGGTFFAGAGSLPQYDGAYLAAAGNVVVVTLNYRLGALGFLAADTLQASISPNLGMQDQQLALRWVQANIGAFGGDSSRVTLFGESAGAMSVGLHLFSIPTSAGLFRAAIMESNLMAFPYRDTTQAIANGNKFLTTLCPSAGCTAVQAGWLQGLTTSQIMLADSAYRVSGTYVLELLGSNDGLSEIIPWSPVLDGTLITGQPLAGYASGTSPKPYVFGMNLDEGVLFSYLLGDTPGIDLNSSFEYTLLLNALYPNQADTIQGWTVSTGSTSYQPYSNKNDSTAYLTPGEVGLSNLLNDALFHCGNLASADSALLANQPDSLPVFGYLFMQPPVFNHPPIAIPACVPQAGNICHTYELPYVFNTLAYADSLPGSIPATPSDYTLGQAMSAAWASFATNLGAPASGWQPYTSNGGLYVWGGSGNGTMQSGWSTARSCTGFWNTIPPIGK
ncbi:MAG TPA: carboxylesterase family protein [Longimicrobium sp.]|nr:carboxylesterase family protein [Longimicrobium sp.]